MLEPVIVRCTRCSEGPAPLPSLRRPCSACGAKVWLDKELPAELAERYPKRVLTVVCMRCRMPNGVGAVETTPGQLRRVLATGVSPAELAHAVAVGVVTGGLGTLEETWAEILSNPTGRKAQQYANEFENAQLDILVATTT